MEISAEKIAQIINGQVVGNKDVKINSFGKIEDAKAGNIAFLSNPKYEHYIYSTKADAVIVKKGKNYNGKVKATLIEVDDPYTAFSKLLNAYKQMMQSELVGEEHPNYVGKDVKLGKNTYRAAFSYIGDKSEIGDHVKIHANASIGKNVKIGEGTVIYAGVKIYDDCIIGKNCVIHSGAVIGSDGFGFAPQQDGSYQTIAQIGNVVVEDHVSIGANTTIDCATFGSTVIKAGSKLDNLIQIAHNVEIGENTVIAAQSGISGSTKLGKNCIIAGQVGIIGHIELANKTTIGAQSGIGSSIKEEGKVMSGSPAMEHKNFLKSSILFTRLPDLYEKVKTLEEKILNLRPEKEK